MINPQEVRRWWDVFHSENRLVEVRVLDKKGKGKRTYSGYFTDCETALAEMMKYDGKGIYAPINCIHDSCYGRDQKDAIWDSPELTTSDNDIAGRSWVLVDLDPKRASGTNSTDAEKRCARNMMVRIGSFLRDQGFSAPVVADSGNGYHLYYKVAMANSTPVRELVQSFLDALAMLFNDDGCDVDTNVFNAARISKIIGTSSAKGADTPDRPRRMSKFVKIPDEVKVTDIAFFQKVADMIPKKEEPSRFNNYSTERFDIETFIRDHNVGIAKRVRFDAGEKLLLEECPFDSNHKSPDSALFLMKSGAIGFKCLHASCAHRAFRDFRLHFDPSAYDRRDYEAFKSREARMSTKEKPAPVIVAETAEKGKKWLSMSEIQYVDPSQLTYIPTGIEEMDKKIGGLALGDVTVMSGLAGAGKTSLIDFVALNAINRGYKVAIWSGELQGFRFQAWMDQCAAGRQFVKAKKGYDNWYYCPKDVADRVNRWLDGKLWLYNNDYGNKFSQIFADMKDCVKENGTQLVVIDNLMALQLDAYEGEKNDRQTTFINDVKNFAKSANISVLLVCHPRKEQMNSLLRMESIAGSSDLYNAVDNVIIAHRVGNDFERRATDFFGSMRVGELKAFHEVIEVAKNRAFGIKDFLVGLFFEMESRRFLNSMTEYIVYGWQETAVQQTLPEPVAPAAEFEKFLAEFEQPEEAWERDNDDDDIGDLPL